MSIQTDKNSGNPSVGIIQNTNKNLGWKLNYWDIDLIRKGRISRESPRAYTRDACERDVLAPCTSPTRVWKNSYARMNELIRAMARYKALIHRVRKHRAYTRETIRAKFAHSEQGVNYVTLFFRPLTSFDLLEKQTFNLPRLLCKGFSKIKFLF